MQVKMDTLPVVLQPIIDNATVTPITVGHSADHVYRVVVAEDEIYYLKIGRSLQAEHERLLWLADKLSVPRVMHFEISGGKHYLLSSVLQGTMLHESSLSFEKRVTLLADAVRMWHAVPIDDCPFSWTVSEQVQTARERLNSGRVDETTFDQQFYGKSANELFADLLNAMPDEEDLMLAHGDFSLPNVLVDDTAEEVVGFVDVGDMGVSDRHLDLVIASRSLWWNMGGAWVEKFYDAYGVPLDKAKYRFYSILTSFF
ncbi:MAG: APH(3') family aminoglycoside O-phosphotransferase [Chloroflexota bacterium]